ncbi:phosphoadenosine phosphosulfate reductase [Roseicyclus sp. F158]|uniref:Phosphoadenosine phosphosulfate reductase n=1 Tax=Tropicimonas omnivorans TaxID=3075590 RepID=A0ABU3DGA6_9RHOB|nr:phosphoadenosine phosphosulfate reductase [Roseicyclus sp. F158]MDT0682747.1 phosphoadenosine phosphosulfate reductase [Roseicyclus sp. F158]
MDGSATPTGPAPEAEDDSHTAAWRARLDAHGRMHGFHERLGRDHGALYTEDDEDVLLVTFENAEIIRDGGETELPYGLNIAGKEGWSQLCLYAEGDTWFRDPDVHAFFDKLIDEGFFDTFKTVLFYGAGPCGYAAAAYSVASPGARLLLIGPQATLEPGIAGWDRRWPEMRRVCFADRFGYAPRMADGAERGWIIYDPTVLEDAMHAALFTRPGMTMLPVSHLGTAPEGHLKRMNILVPILRAAGKGTFDARAFARHWRRRHAYPPYLRRTLGKLEEEDRPLLAALWARAALRVANRPRFRRALAAAEEALAAKGRTLPPAREDD